MWLMTIKSIWKLYKTIMLLSPEVLLSPTSRERCIVNLSELPVFIKSDKFTKNAAVLVPICVVEGEVCLLFTLRSSNLSSHSGQVSFPGGKMDENETVFQTAVRETYEEIGIPPENVEIWAKMSQVQGKDTSIVITPVVGVLKNFDVKNVRPNENEVAEVFTVPMKVFCDKANHACFIIEKFPIPVFDCGKHKVWGITGLITHFFLQCFLSKDIYEGDFSRFVYKLEELLPSKL